VAEPKDNWDKAQVVISGVGSIAAILVPIALLIWGQEYKKVEDARADQQRAVDKARADEQKRIENSRAESAAEMQSRSAKAAALIQLIPTLADTSEHKEALAIRAVEIGMPIEAPGILGMVKNWHEPTPTNTPATTTAETIDKVLDDAKRQAVQNLFNPEDKTARGRAYNQITQSAWRSDIELAKAILDAAEERFSFERGIDNAVVALRDMSRQATQKDPAVRSRILAFADKVEKEYPGLQEDTKSLRKWISEDEKPPGANR
jgi:hypothetical protein